MNVFETQACVFLSFPPVHGAADSPDTTSIPRWTFKSSQSSTLPKSIEEVLMCSALMCLRCICCFPVLWIRPSLKPLWKHTACGAAKSHPVEERKRASQHQTLRSAHCCQCATLPHATTNQYQCITIETTWINTLLMAFVYSAFLSFTQTVENRWTDSEDCRQFRWLGRNERIAKLIRFYSRQPLRIFNEETKNQGKGTELSKIGSNLGLGVGNRWVIQTTALRSRFTDPMQT